MKTWWVAKARFTVFDKQCRKCIYGPGGICTLDTDCTKCKMYIKAGQNCHCCVKPSKDEKECKFFKEAENK